MKNEFEKWSNEHGHTYVFENGLTSHNALARDAWNAGVKSERERSARLIKALKIMAIGQSAESLRAKELIAEWEAASGRE